MYKEIREYSSFRDPSGYIYEKDGVLYRRVESCYHLQYNSLMQSGLYDALCGHKWLIPHEEMTEEGALILRPEAIPFVSYPYEWSFAQLKDAALLTLRIYRLSLDYGMILKDASAYNVQFHKGRPIFIDTLSFKKYDEGMPFLAYGQFCRHFLAPLLLMSALDMRLNKLMIAFIDGLPLDLVATMLHGKGGLFAMQHIVWHARSIQRHMEDGKKKNDSIFVKLPLHHHVALIESLIRGIEKLNYNTESTEWADYYEHTNYSSQAVDSKKQIIEGFLREIAPRTVWDFGSNDGTYSRLALAQGAKVVAFDQDAVAVSKNYAQAKQEALPMLPLILDLTNPSPNIGFANRERMGLVERKKPDCILTLALIHHIVISNNVPFEKLAQWLSELSPNLVIEFVPKEDSQVQILMATRKDIFPQYTAEAFEMAFSQYFECASMRLIHDSARRIYWYVRKAK